MDLKETQANWNLLGKNDPLYGVLSHEGKRGGAWDKDEFFATGVKEISELFDQMKGFGLSCGTDRALDFGCAVGRLTQALAPHFKQVTGVDIAPAMLELADRYNQFGPRCRYLLNENPDLRIFPDSSFDLVYSNIVLQHMAPEFALAYISEFVRVLSAAGLLVFQIPERPHYALLRLALKGFTPKPLLRLYRKLRYSQSGEAPEIEMNALAPWKVEEAVARAGGELRRHGQGWYWVTKKK